MAERQKLDRVPVNYLIEFNKRNTRGQFTKETESGKVLEKIETVKGTSRFRVRTTYPQRVVELSGGTLVINWGPDGELVPASTI